MRLQVISYVMMWTETVARWCRLGQGCVIFNDEFSGPLMEDETIPHVSV